MIVNCVAYDRGQKLSDIPLTEVRTHLANRDCFVWVALKDPEPAELAVLQEEFSLHELAIEDAHTILRTPSRRLFSAPSPNSRLPGSRT